MINQKILVKMLIIFKNKLENMKQKLEIMKIDSKISKLILINLINNWLIKMQKLKD